MVIRDLNESPRPRVLVELPDSSRAAALKALEGLSGTVRVVMSLGEVSLAEWDVLVTHKALGRKVFPPGQSPRLRQFVPKHLNVIVLQSRTEQFDDLLFDDGGTLTLQLGTKYARGKMAVMGGGLPDELSDLVKKDLAKIVASRSEQFGLKVVNAAGGAPEALPRFSPLLIGPESLVYAARYDREPGHPVWVLPEDLMDFGPWFRIIFEGWHALDPQTYPGAPDWLSSDKWMTPVEAAKAGEIAAGRDSFAALRDAHDEQQAALATELEELRSASASKERLLLSGQNFALQDQVLLALQEIGFTVEDMDMVWDEKEPREDYRILDEAVPGWMVIGDATGTTKGVKGAKLMTVERYVTKYVAENPGGLIPNYWVIANQFADRDPDSRPADLVRGDDLAVLQKNGDLVLDTVALFHLLMAVRLDPGRKEAVRSFIRAQAGQLTAKMARDWLAAST